MEARGDKPGIDSRVEMDLMKSYIAYYQKVSNVYSHVSSEDAYHIFAVSGFLALAAKVPTGCSDTFEGCRRGPKRVVMLSGRIIMLV